MAGLKQEVFQALSVNASMISHGSPKKKLSQAEVAQETQIDILTTSDAVTVIENGVLTPLVNFFIELDHQYREDNILVRSFGDLGMKAVMQDIEPIQMDNRYEFRWFGVEAARNAQQVQQQISGMNVLRLPPQLYPGYKLDLAPAISQMVENIFGPRLAALTFVDMRSQLGHDPKLEVELATQGVELPVGPMDNHQVAMQLLVKALQETGDPSGIIRVQLMKHQQIMMMQAQAQQQAMMGPQGGAGTTHRRTTRAGYGWSTTARRNSSRPDERRRCHAEENVMKIILTLFAFLAVAPALADDSAAEYWMKERAYQHRNDKQVVLVVRGKKHIVQAPSKNQGSLLANAMKYLGMGNITGFRGPWCGAFMGMIAKETGKPVPKDYKVAAAWSKVGTRISKPEVGAVAVMRHHVGIVLGVKDGKVLLISGNHNRRVGEGLYAQRRIIAYVRI